MYKLVLYLIPHPPFKQNGFGNLVSGYIGQVIQFSVLGIEPRDQGSTVECGYYKSGTLSKAQKSVYNGKQLILRRLVTILKFVSSIVLASKLTAFAKSLFSFDFFLLRNTVLSLSRPRSLFFFVFCI